MCVRHQAVDALGGSRDCNRSWLELCSRPSITSAWKSCFDYTNHRLCHTSKALHLQYITLRHLCCNASIERSCASFEKFVVLKPALCCNFGLLLWSLDGISPSLVCCTESCWVWRPLKRQLCSHSSAQRWSLPVDNDCGTGALFMIAKFRQPRPSHLLMCSKGLLLAWPGATTGCRRKSSSYKCQGLPETFTAYLNEFSGIRSG